MKILAIDIGTGTQDVLLYDSRLDIENGYKLILPSPTLTVRRRIQAASRSRQDILLTGSIMGGGPCGWAVSDHIASGLRVFATPEAAKTFDDDLAKVAGMGVILVSEDEAVALAEKTMTIEMRDFDHKKILRAYSEFDVDLSDLAAVSVAVFDHGNAPADMSDRKFRFNYLEQRVNEENRLSAFAYLRPDIPSFLTRLQAVADSNADLVVPLVVMDTAPAAVLGATFDRSFKTKDHAFVANIGNAHTLAFKLGPEGIAGVFEHHTGLLNQASFDSLVEGLIAGTLTNDEVFSQHGHGAFNVKRSVESTDPRDHVFLVTGPRHSLIQGSRFNPHLAVPFGDMMLSGCFGLLSAAADLLPEIASPIRASLDRAVPGGQGKAPWDLD